MPVFQASDSIIFQVGYKKYKFYKGQPVSTTDPKLINFFNSNPTFKETENNLLVRLAPSIDQIKTVYAPLYMNKDDIVKELAEAGVYENPYQLHDTLALKLQTVRQMKKRNFVTVIDERGLPVFIDKVKNLQTPLIGETADQLPEPPEIDPSDYIHTTKNSEIELVDEKNKDGTSGIIEKINDVEDNKSFDDFINTFVPEATITQDSIIDNSPPIPKPKKIKLVPDDEIQDVSNWKYLIEPQDGIFVESITPEQLKSIRVLKKPKIGQVVYQRFVTLHGVWEVEADAHNNRRWSTANKAGEIIENMEDESDRLKAYIEINMLQKRFEEISKVEPDYRKSTVKQVKRKLTMLSKYGIDLNFKEDTDIKQYAKLAFQIAKMGLQVPDTIDDMKLLLDKYNNL